MSGIMDPIDEYDQTEEGKLARSLMVAAIKVMLDKDNPEGSGVGRGIFVTGRDDVQYMLMSEGDELKVHTIDPDAEPHPDGTTFTFDLDPEVLH